MRSDRLDIVVLGLSLSSSWGNGHATTYRALLKAMAERGHAITFLERDQPWYAKHRDFTEPDWCRLVIYQSLNELQRHASLIAGADAVIVGSYVPDGIAVGHYVQRVSRGVTCFYDIDTPITMTGIERGTCAYLTPELIAGYDVYLSFTGGPLLRDIERWYGSPDARALYCTADTDAYRPRTARKTWDLSYLGTYSADRQPTLDQLLIETARRAPHLSFAVAGPQYPDAIDWPANVERIEHVPPQAHPDFYAASRWTLNVTRADMIKAGYSPSVRLFEAAACATPIISDTWDGIDTLFVPGREIMLAQTVEDVLQILNGSNAERIGRAAHAVIATRHSARHRAEELEAAIEEARDRHPGVHDAAVASERMTG
jgi:spore maturation protein CgeB